MSARTNFGDHSQKQDSRKQVCWPKKHSAIKSDNSKFTALLFFLPRLWHAMFGQCISNWIARPKLQWQPPETPLMARIRSCGATERLGFSWRKVVGKNWYFWDYNLVDFNPIKMSFHYPLSYHLEKSGYLPTNELLIVIVCSSQSQLMG